MPDNSEIFKNECFNLFGNGWQHEVARRLGINERSVRRYANGERHIPEAVMGILSFWKGEAHE